MATIKKNDQNNENQELKDQITDLKNKYLRALADYQNLEKRTQEQIQSVRLYAAESLITRLLSVVDTLEKAVEHTKDPGVSLALKEFMVVLQEAGVMKLSTINQPFNPHEMECIEVVEGEENIVVSEALAGYTMQGKIIRVAQVKVGKNMLGEKRINDTN